MSPTAVFGGKQNRFYEIGDGSGGLAISNLHYAAAKALGFTLAYIPKKVEKAGLSQLYRSLCGSAAGFTLTSPFKTEIIMMLDAIDDDASAIGACNVIACEKGRFKGYNTDWVAIRNVLKRKGLKPVRNRALVIGTGATARASLYSLWRLGFTRMILSGRNQASSGAIVKGLGFIMGVDAVSLPYLEAFKSLELRGFDVIVNATPLGRKEGEDPTLAAAMPADGTILDLALSSSPTRLAKRAVEAGCKIIGGEEVAAEEALLDVHVWAGSALP